MVQFYGADDRRLVRNVGRYLLEGLKVGDGLLVIGVQQRNLAIAKALNEVGADAAASVREGQICFLDAEETLGEFMLDGQPYWRRFENSVGTRIREIRTRVGHGGLRAYGEMVGVLWEAGQHSAAIRLEQFWNKFLTRCSASLFCAYPIDILAEDFQVSSVDALLCAHTHLVPTDLNGELESAVNRALESVLGSTVNEIRCAIEAKTAWAAAPNGEATLLWVGKNLPDCADEILARVRQFYRPTCQIAC
jgi:hypothetical protein